MDTNVKNIFSKVINFALIVTISFTLIGNTWNNVYAHNYPDSRIDAHKEIDDGQSDIEIINPNLSIEYVTLDDGAQLSGYIINGPSHPPSEYSTERLASMKSIIDAVILPNFPSYNWVFGCSAVSGSMIAGYMDRGAYPNLYTGPTNGGVMPLSDTSWSTWSDGLATYPNNPLIASHNGVDGRSTRGSIDDYWVYYGSSSNDPYITNGWQQHSWGTAIGDYMKTSQSAYTNTDGSTKFYNYTYLSNKLNCSYMESQGIAEQDGTYGRKLFYQARGYSVTDCYNQNTDNNISGGFSLANFQAEINAGYPVLLNLYGHSIVGYGYNGSTIYIRDTWDSDPSHTYTMPWGGSYQRMELYSVSVVHVTVPQVIKHTYLPLVTKPTSVNPIQNGDFELGPVNWEEFSTHNWKLILDTSVIPVAPYNGSWAVWTGGDDDEISYIQQQVTVPTASPYLSYRHWIASEDTCGHDYAKVKVNGSVVDTYNLCDATDTNGWVQKVINLNAYAGTSVMIQIGSENNSSLNSNLFIDNVTFQVNSEVLDQTINEYFGGGQTKQEILGK